MLDHIYKLFSEDLALSFLNWLRVSDPGELYKFSNFQKDIKDVEAPLYYALFIGLQDTTQRLLGAGAKVNNKGNEYSSALLVASKKGHYEIPKWLLDDYGANIGCVELSPASKGGYIQTVQLLLDWGLDVNESSSELGYNPLPGALAHCQKFVTLLLPEHGTDVNAQDPSHGSVLERWH